MLIFCVYNTPIKIYVLTYSLKMYFIDEHLILFVSLQRDNNTEVNQFHLQIVNLNLIASTAPLCKAYIVPSFHKCLKTTMQAATRSKSLFRSVLLFNYLAFIHKVPLGESTYINCLLIWYKGENMTTTDTIDLGIKSTYFAPSDPMAKPGVDSDPFLWHSV